MKRNLQYAACAMVALLPASYAAAQESVFDFFGGILGSDKAEESAPDSPAPPDETTSYFGNKQTALPEHIGDISGLAGAWTITTERNSASCTLDGHAQIRVSNSGGYTCDLVMRDYCENRHDGIIRQSCKIEFVGERISVVATVLESLNGATLSGYSPDDFVLSHQEDGNLYGNHEGYSGYPTVWRRIIDGIS